ncbi:MAG TPA: hypothetical protein VJ772_11110 [Nitrososphaeraceae archaeon]|nr:hypothetical protein [Nitrososphaeraceae archaeon]
MFDIKYHKIKHLVEVEDDILAVFTISLNKENQIENLSIAKNANLAGDLVDKIFKVLKHKLEETKSETNIGNVVSHLKWTIYETDLVRILIIHETDYSVIVLIKSKTNLSETVDNILGYYYESE